MPRKSSQRNKTAQRKTRQREILAKERAEALRFANSPAGRAAAHRHAEARMAAMFAALAR